MIPFNTTPCKEDNFFKLDQWQLQLLLFPNGQPLLKN